MIKKKKIEDILTKWQTKDYRSKQTVISVHDFGYVAGEIIDAINKDTSSRPIIDPTPEIDESEYVTVKVKVGSYIIPPEV